MRGPLTLLDRPWVAAVLGGAGMTVLLSGAGALLAPLRVLDAAVGLGELRLLLCAAALFVAATCILRVVLHRERPPEDRVLGNAPPARSYLR